MAKTRRVLDRDSVVNKAAEIADEIGLERLTITLLAERLTVRPPSIYNHVKNLDDLYNQLTYKGIRDLQAILESSLLHTDEDQRLAAMSKAVRDFARQNPTLFLCASRNFSLSSQEFDVATAGLMTVIDSGFSTLQLGAEKSQFSQLFLRCLINGFISLEANNALGPVQDTDALFDSMVEMATRAILD
jgi:AcrR family transcriptional regulator